MKNKLCISIGDINGIGIEMILNKYDKYHNYDIILFTNLGSSSDTISSEKAPKSSLLGRGESSRSLLDDCIAQL